jgi:DNA-binding MarR family transcriptional regulator
VNTSTSKFSQCLYFSSNALARKIEKLAQESWDKVNLSPSHAYLLLLTLDNPGIQPKAISEQLQLQPSTVTRLLEKLEQKKLVVRTSEGKLTNVYPTPKARELWPEMQECLNDFKQNCDAAIGEVEIKTLVKDIVKVADKFKL